MNLTSINARNEGFERSASVMLFDSVTFTGRVMPRSSKLFRIPSRCDRCRNVDTTTCVMDCDKPLALLAVGSTTGKLTVWSIGSNLFDTVGLADIGNGSSTSIRLAEWSGLGSIACLDVLEDSLQQPVDSLDAKTGPCLDCSYVRILIFVATAEGILHIIRAEWKFGSTSIDKLNLDSTVEGDIKPSDSISSKSLRRNRSVSSLGKLITDSTMLNIKEEFINAGFLVVLKSYSVPVNATTMVIGEITQSIVLTSTELKNNRLEVAIGTADHGVVLFAIKMDKNSIFALEAIYHWTLPDSVHSLCIFPLSVSEKSLLSTTKSLLVVGVRDQPSSLWYATLWTDGSVHWHGDDCCNGTDESAIMFEKQNGGSVMSEVHVASLQPLNSVSHDLFFCGNLLSLTSDGLLRIVRISYDPNPSHILLWERFVDAPVLYAVPLEYNSLPLTPCPSLLHGFRGFACILWDGTVFVIDGYHQALVCLPSLSEVESIGVDSFWKINDSRFPLFDMLDRDESVSGDVATIGAATLGVSAFSAEYLLNPFSQKIENLWMAMVTLTGQVILFPNIKLTSVSLPSVSSYITCKNSLLPLLYERIHQKFKETKEDSSNLQLNKTETIQLLSYLLKD